MTGAHRLWALGSVFAGLCGDLMLAPAAAAEVSHGELAGHIRSSGYPCAHVLQVGVTGDSAWDVECNSGAFSVSRDSAGRYTVTPGSGVTREHGADVDADDR